MTATPRKFAVPTLALAAAMLGGGMMESAPSARPIPPTRDGDHDFHAALAKAEAKRKRKAAKRLRDVSASRP
jgi:hypothetical protein